MVDENGMLPNYGANDGALFFKLNSAHFRDYRPQLQALANVLGTDAGFDNYREDCEWYGLTKGGNIWQPASGTHSFDKGGYYIIREPQTLTFVRCGNHKDRPSQADNLHLDIWYKGESILLDAGSYKYNTDEQTTRYFSGTRSHNTVILDDYDQMLKGGRFIWYYWTQCEEAQLKEDEGSYVFEGAIHAFLYLDRNIVHRRTIVKSKGKPNWSITDEITGAGSNLEMRQLWHMPLRQKNELRISASDRQSDSLTPAVHEGWYSSLYGQKEKTTELYFSSHAPITAHLTVEES
jgi:hypothetical protein